MKSSTPLTVEILIALLSLLEVNHRLAYKPSYFLNRSFSDFYKMKERYYRAFYNALRYKYLKKRLVKNVVYFEVTRKGRYKALKYILKNKLKNKEKEKWDRKWRLFIFDIPEKKSILRERLRENLQLLGFKYLQKSVWVTPYDIRKELGIVVDYLNIKSYVHFMVVEVLEDDGWLRKQFRIG